MCIFFGWEHGTKVIRRYLHLSGKDVDDTLLAITEGEYARAVVKQELFTPLFHIVLVNKLVIEPN